MRYQDDLPFILKVQKLAGLAYVPKNEVINVYDELLDTVHFTENDE